MEGRPTYRRRTPEETVLYQVLAEHLETFVHRIDSGELSWPAFVTGELRSFLDCGILARGFARVHCTQCGKDALVALSCKGRGFCPSCGVRPSRRCLCVRGGWLRMSDDRTFQK